MPGGGISSSTVFVCLVDEMQVTVIGILCGTEMNKVQQDSLRGRGGQTLTVFEKNLVFSI